MARCERQPPPGWPGGACGKPVKFDVVYRINGTSDLRGIRLCLEHMAELRELDKRGGLAELDAKGVA